MDQATEFMALAAHCRRQARLETNPQMREKLVEKAAEYDARACSCMMALEDNCMSRQVYGRTESAFHPI